MKKVSTRAAAQSRNISRLKLTVGLDLGDRNSFLPAITTSGAVTFFSSFRSSDLSQSI